MNKTPTTTTKEFTQVCVWPSTIVGKDNANDFEVFMKKEFKIRVKYLEEIKTVPDFENGKPVENTGGRNDVFFVIHSADIPNFAIKRFAMNPPVRWIEDVLGNEKARGDSSLYPERVRKYLTWDYGLDELHEEHEEND